MVSAEPGCLVVATVGSLHTRKSRAGNTARHPAHKTTVLQLGIRDTAPHPNSIVRVLPTQNVTMLAGSFQKDFQYPKL